jgi:hypothetical protein
MATNFVTTIQLQPRIKHTAPKFSTISPKHHKTNRILPQQLPQPPQVVNINLLVPCHDSQTSSSSFHPLRSYFLNTLPISHPTPLRNFKNSSNNLHRTTTSSRLCCTITSTAGHLIHKVLRLIPRTTTYGMGTCSSETPLHPHLVPKIHSSPLERTLTLSSRPQSTPISRSHACQSRVPQRRWQIVN